MMKLKTYMTVAVAAIGLMGSGAAFAAKAAPAKAKPAVRAPIDPFALKVRPVVTAPVRIVVTRTPAKKPTPAVKPAKPVVVTPAVTAAPPVVVTVVRPPYVPPKRSPFIPPPAGPFLP